MVDNSVEVVGGKWLECTNNLSVVPQFSSQPRDDFDVNLTVDKIVDFLILSFPADTVRKLTVALNNEFSSLNVKRIRELY